MIVFYLLIGILVGIVIAIFLIRRILLRRFFVVLQKTSQLRTTGTRIQATVTRIETYPYVTLPKQTYFLVVQWQQPETGKIYTYRGTTKSPERFSIGSDISILIDPTNPELYIIEALQE